MILVSPSDIIYSDALDFIPDIIRSQDFSLDPSFLVLELGARR
jgi:hypothetical protein